ATPQNAALVFLAICVTTPFSVYAQTTLTGSAMVLNSSVSSTLSGPNYLGTYVTIPAGGATVNFTLNATEGSEELGGSDPHMKLLSADTKFGVTVNNTLATDYTTGNVFLPAGTYVVRAERDYAAPASTSMHSVAVNSLSVNTVNGASATFNNTNTDANA